MRHFSCDGRDFWDVYTTMYEAFQYIKEAQLPVVMHVHSLPRFNGHSSAADVTFDLGQDDPLLRFGEALVERGVMKNDEIMRRIEGSGRDFFAHHELGSVMTGEDEVIKALLTQVRAEPDPPPESIHENIMAPFPDVVERAGEGTTNITYAGAIRAALDQIIEEKNGAIWGQDVGRLGGVMQATAGIKKSKAARIIDAPLNEP